MLPPLATELNPKDQIQFIASHRPGLLAGDYTLDVGQEVTITGTPHWFPRTGQNFSVLGERFQLPPEQIHVAFPPPGSRGDFWRDLPHVILTRSTLPWERTALGGSSLSENDPPWLALIVFHGAEAPSPGETADNKPLGRGIVPLSSLLSPVSGAGSQHRWPGIEMKSGQHNEDQVTVIDVPWQLLKEQLPVFDYQTHCRGRLAYLDSQPSSEAEFIKTLSGILKGQQPTVMLSSDAAVEELQSDAGIRKWRVHDRSARQEYEFWQSEPDQCDFYRVADENAVILGPRLPMPGQRNVVHLVSLEGRYSNVATFDFQDAAPTDLIRLVSLYNWEFFCEDPTKDFKGLLENLNKDPQGSETPSTFRLPVPPALVPDAAASTDEKTKLQIASQDAEKFLHAGFVPLVHRFRQGSHSVSWYHGPLVPGELGGTHTDPDTKQSTPGTVTPCASAADELLIYDKDRGMFDASYAAAWELGRMLTLRNLRVATSLYHWKRDHVQSLNAARYLMDYGFELPVNTGQNARNLSWPDEVGQWLNELTLLRHVPFPIWFLTSGFCPWSPCGSSRWTAPGWNACATAPTAWAACRRPMRTGIRAPSRWLCSSPSLQSVVFCCAAKSSLVSGRACGLGLTQTRFPLGTKT